MMPVSRLVRLGLWVTLMFPIFGKTQPVCTKMCKKYEACFNFTNYTVCPPTGDLLGLRFEDGGNLTKEHICHRNKPLRFCDFKQVQHDAFGFSNLLVAVLWIMTFASLGGNALVIYRSAREFQRGFTHRTKVQRVHNILLFNLSLADLLMGIYLLTFSSVLTSNATNVRQQHMKLFKLSKACTAIAILNFISSEVSVTVLAIVTTCRLYSVMWPYKNIRVRAVVAAVCVTWAVWVAAACMPLARGQDRYFQVKLSQCATSHAVREDVLLNKLDKALANATNDRCDCDALDCDKYILVLGHAAVGKGILEMFESMEGGYYNKLTSCTLCLFFDDPDDEAAYFSLIIVSYNVIAFVYMLAAYLFICRRATPGAHWCSKHVVANLRRCVGGTPEESQRDAENRRMHRRIFFIICTDFLCWIPISSVAIGHWIAISTRNHEHHSPDFWKLINTFSLATVVMLPINSAINPFLYSTDHVWERCCCKTAKKAAPVLVEGQLRTGPTEQVAIASRSSV